jgi:hypothetical protein
MLPEPTRQTTTPERAEPQSSDAPFGAGAVAHPSPMGTPGTDCQETTLPQNAWGGSPNVDREKEENVVERAPGRDVNGPPAASADAVVDDPFTPTEYSAWEKLIDAFALASHEGFLARGDDPYRWEPERESYEPWPALDFVRQDGSIKISEVEWDGPIPRLTTYPSPVTYHGRVYRVPSLPATMPDCLFLPTGVTGDYSARKVFDAVYTLLQDSAILSDQQSELLTFWVIATWFADVLDSVPRLTITGSRFAAGLLFQLLRYVCRRAVLLVGIKPAVVKQIPLEDLQPTLLIHEIRPGKAAAEFLDASDLPGSFVACGGELRQFFYPTCVYVGEVPDPRGMGSGLHLHLGRNASLPARPYRSNKSVVRLQNLLFTYRCFNLGRLQDFPPSPQEFVPNVAAAARRLGAVIFEDSELQNRVDESLREQSEQMRVDRASGIDGIVLQAVLVLAHRDEPPVYSRDVAATANQICIEQGESVKLSAEKVGHALKRLGLYTRRLGSNGRGLILDKATQIRAHQLSLEYNVLPVVPECGYCHNLQAPPSEDVM